MVDFCKMSVLSVFQNLSNITFVLDRLSYTLMYMSILLPDNGTQVFQFAFENEVNGVKLEMHGNTSTFTHMKLGLSILI